MKTHPLKRNDKSSYIGFIEGIPDGFVVNVWDTRDKENYMAIKVSTDKQLVEQVKKIFDQRFDGIVVLVYDAKTTEYLNNHEFCNKLRCELDSLKVPYHFFSSFEMCISRTLILTNYKPYLGDKILHIIVARENYLVQELQFTENGYKQVSRRCIPIVADETLNITKSRILEDFKPLVIIGCASNSSISPQKCKQMFKNMDFQWADFYQNPDLHYTLLLEMVKWIKNKTYRKLTILPNTYSGYVLTCFMGNKTATFQFCTEIDQLPFFKTIAVKQPCLPISIDSNRNSKQQTIQALKNLQSAHVQLVTIKIDTDRIVRYGARGYIIPEVSELPQTLEQNCEKKIPVVAFFGISSVICIAKDKKEYNFSKEWGGLYGNTVAINFEKEKPQFGSNVIIPGKTNMNHVLYDFIKLMSMSPTNIVVEPFWQFSITSCEEHPVLMGFEDFTGARRQTPLDNAMAAILKEHLRAIKAETGKRPKEIGICLIDDFKKNELERIQSQLVECCKLLKISCIFVKP